MSRLIPCMILDFTLTAANTIFASDAQGAGEVDVDEHGGYGVVAADFAKSQIWECWSSSFVPGKAIVKLDGSLGQQFGSKANLLPTVPFARLPRSIFDASWSVLAHGRWRISEHIALGEGRAHFKIVQCLSAHGDTHDIRIIALEDNFAGSASMSKGRSPAPALNCLVRRRAASSLASNVVVASPWIETSKMPADAASRLKHGAREPSFGAALSGSDHRAKGSADYGQEVPQGRASIPIVHH